VFTPLLSVLHETAAEDGVDFEVIYVSSDRSAADCTNYMNQKHGDWLRIPFGEANDWKKTYGVFAGMEQLLFPATKRRSGIPTLVVVGSDGEEKALLDCDNRKVLQEIESKGSSFLDDWKQYAW